MSGQLTTDEEELVIDQLKTFGVMKFPKDFMNIGEKQFDWVYDNRPEWVEFTSKWETADGLFKFWYLYVKLRRSISTKEHDQSANGTNCTNEEKPYYTISLDE